MWTHTDTEGRRTDLSTRYGAEALAALVGGHAMQTVWVACVDTPTEDFPLVDTDRAGLLRQLAAYCRDNWHDDDALPIDDQATVDAFFAASPRASVVFFGRVPVGGSGT